MSAPTSAAIADAMNYAAFLRGLDSLSWEQRTISDLSLEVIRMRDHIRAITEEMRAEANECTKLAQGSVYELAEFRLRTAKTLGRFADKLEGKQ